MKGVNLAPNIVQRKQIPVVLRLMMYAIWKLQSSLEGINSVIA